MTLIETASATATLPALKEEQAQKFVLTLSCQEQAGIVQAVTTFLFERGFNIDEHQQFDDSLRETLHLRTAFSGSPNYTPAMLEEEFTGIASRFGMKFSFHGQTKQRVLVMVSKFGHCLNDLIFRWRGGSLGGELVAVVSNHETHRAMAEAAGLPFIYVPVSPDTKADAERRLLELVDEYDADLVVRMLSMGRFPPAVPRTGSVAPTLAAGAAGTVVHDLVAPTGPLDGLRLATPAGCVSTFVEDHDGVPVVGVVRTYRRLASGTVLLPDPPLLPSASA